MVLFEFLQFSPILGAGFAQTRFNFLVNRVNSVNRVNFCLSNESRLNRISIMKFTLIRGLAREGFHWNIFPEKILEAFPGSEIELLDLQGNGKYSSINSPINPEKYLEFLRMQSRFVKNNQKTTIIAVSFAAMISQEWVKQYPDEIKALVFINTSLRPTSIFYRMRPSGLVKLMSAARMRNDYKRERKILELTTCLLGDRISPLEKEWGARAKEYRTSRKNTLKQLWTAARMTRMDHTPSVPCLILSSKGDALVHPKSSEELAQAWNVSHSVHPKAGHDLSLDDPMWVIQQIQNFLN